MTSAGGGAGAPIGTAVGGDLHKIAKQSSKALQRKSTDISNKLLKNRLVNNNAAGM